MNYERDISIDETALDVEWLDQPRLMLKYAQYAAKCKTELDRAKEALDVVKAELDREIRQNPGDYGVNKITESAVQSAILVQPQYQQASKDYTDSKYEYEIAVAAVRAIDQKKTALENLVKLHGMSYFAGPQVPRDLSTEWQKKQQQAKSDQKVKIRRAK